MLSIIMLSTLVLIVIIPAHLSLKTQKREILYDHFTHQHDENYISQIDDCAIFAAKFP